MSIELFRYPSYAWGIIFCALMVCMLFALIMNLFVPKIMKETYFKEPYFSSNLIAIYDAFPFNTLKSFIYMRLAGWPDSGKKRGIPANAHEVAPVWFQVVSRVFIRTYLVLFSLLMVLSVILGIAFTVLDMW